MDVFFACEDFEFARLDQVVSSVDRQCEFGVPVSRRRQRGRRDVHAGGFGIGLDISPGSRRSAQRQRHACICYRSPIFQPGEIDFPGDLAFDALDLVRVLDENLHIARHLRERSAARVAIVRLGLRCFFGRVSAAPQPADGHAPQQKRYDFPVHGSFSIALPMARSRL